MLDYILEELRKFEEQVDAFWLDAWPTVIRPCLKLFGFLMPFVLLFGVLVFPERMGACGA